MQEHDVARSTSDASLRPPLKSSKRASTAKRRAPRVDMIVVKSTLQNKEKEKM